MKFDVDSDNARWRVQMSPETDEVTIVLDGVSITLPALEGFKLGVAVKAATEVIMGRGDRPTMDELIEQSSFSSPHAKDLRDQTPEAATAEIMRRIHVKGDDE